MKSLLATLTIAFAVLSAFAADRPLPPGVKTISINETEALIKANKDVTILDVRRAEELQELGHIPGTKHIDFLREDFDKAVLEAGIDKNKPCIVYCAVGGRAKRAAAQMSKAGFKEIILPEGSFNAWKAAGKPVQGGKNSAK